MGSSSEFGAFLDPVADKLMVATTLVLLCTRPPAMAWARVAPWLLPLPAIAIIGREVLVPKSLLLGRCNVLCLVVSIKMLAAFVQCGRCSIRFGFQIECQVKTWQFWSHRAVYDRICGFADNNVSCARVGRISR
jgi:phosphatidylglycerophosphate synthase